MYLGIDIGGTKTLVASLNDDGSIADKIKFDTSQDYQTFLKDLKTNLHQLPAKEFSYCGVGMPGILDRATGASKWAGGNLAWGSSPITDDISEIVGCKAVVENDANMAGLSEANLIKDRYKTALYLTISTGIGGVYVVNGKIDMNMADAEVGHMLYKQGDAYETWEEITSGKAIVEKFGQRADEITEPGIWKAISEPIAVGLINLSAALTPEAIIIGGGVGANLHHFKSYLEEAIRQLKPEAITVPPILQAQHAEEAVLYGCYELAKQRSGSHGKTN